MAPARIGIRWTIGNVGHSGFEALRLSMWGARKVFGPDADLAVCVNSVAPEWARALAGDVPRDARWLDATNLLPDFLKAHFDQELAEGMGWKFAPLQIFGDRYELALDNDCILWGMPEAIRGWLSSAGPRCLIAEDVETLFGQFADMCGPEPRNSGLRGLPPGFDLESALREVLSAHPTVLHSEFDEQGLQTAIVSRGAPPFVVSKDDLALCSPFPPHSRQLGRCGAHFIGLNASQRPRSFAGRPAVEQIQEFWVATRPAVYEKLGVAPERAWEELSTKAV